MSHAPEHHENHDADDAPAPPSMRDLNVPLILTIGIVSVLLLFVVIVGTQAWFNYEAQQEFEQKVVRRGFDSLDGQVDVAELTRQQQQKLTGPPSWRQTQAGKAVATVPIDTAIDYFVQQQAQTRPAPQTEPQAQPGGGAG
jgi:hypothetical protein